MTKNVCVIESNLFLFSPPHPWNYFVTSVSKRTARTECKLETTPALETHRRPSRSSVVQIRICLRAAQAQIDHFVISCDVINAGCCRAPRVRPRIIWRDGRMLLPRGRPFLSQFLSLLSLLRTAPKRWDLSNR